MGVHCEINLMKPADGAYVPGTMISGVIKYAFDEETTIKKIIVSLKGSGFLRIRDNDKKRKDRKYTFRNSETYVDEDCVIQQDEKGAVFPVGLYETKFSFRVPENIPGSLQYSRLMARYNIRCIIAYYVRIKFEKPGMFTLNKHFRKDITVVSGITPRLPTLPTIYGEQKNLFHLFSWKESTVNIKANVESCVITPGGKIELNYEVANNSLVAVKAVETKLVEKYTFHPRGHIAVRAYADVANTDTKTPSIEVGDTQKMLVVMNVPTEKSSIENSEMVAREYIVVITVVLPMPHFNATLEIPVQIGGSNVRQNSSSAVGQFNPSALLDDQFDPSAPPTEPNYDDPPPSYWEVMGEHPDDKEKDIEYSE